MYDARRLSEVWLPPAACCPWYARKKIKNNQLSCTKKKIFGAMCLAIQKNRLYMCKAMDWWSKTVKNSKRKIEKQLVKLYKTSHFKTMRLVAQKELCLQ